MRPTVLAAVLCALLAAGPAAAQADHSGHAAAGHGDNASTERNVARLLTGQLRR